MTRQRFTCRCKRCGHRWKTTATRPPTNCPNLDCGESMEAAPFDFASQKAPAQVGQSHYVMAADLTAEIAMTDYGLSNLNGGGTSLRTGDVMAPKLPPAQQEKADNFFGGPPKPQSGGQSLDARKAISTAMASAGAFGPPPIADMHRRKVTVPVRTVAGYNG